MAKGKKKEKPNPDKKNKAKETGIQPEEQREDSFDFGGLPKEVDLKKNIGCGG